MIKKLLIVPLLALFLVAGTASAQTEDLPNAGMLPGNPFYFLETLSEGIGTFLTFGDVKKAERHLRLASERLAEAGILSEKGETSRSEKTVERYQNRIDKALAKAEEAKIRGKDIDVVLERIAEATVRHQVVLAGLYEKIPEQATDAIENAMERSARGYETALRAVSDEKRDEIRNRVEEKTEDLKSLLREFRGKGVPVPDIDEDDEVDEMDEEEDDEDDEVDE